jgi:ribosomal protein L11 methyltransferase
VTANEPNSNAAAKSATTGSSARTWFALEVSIELAAREAVEYALMESGSIGTEFVDDDDSSARVIGYFDTPPDREQVRAALFEALRLYSLPSSSVRDIQFKEIADRDWLGEWKKSWQPVEHGRFVIAPPWSEVSDAPGRLIIRIEPGMAFGTGTHETTRLCLKAIEKYFAGGTFLDVGTGTGILAIAAAKLLPGARVEACDTDPEAVRIARENARLNDVDEQIAFRLGSVDETSTASADLVCANLTADVIVPLLPQLIGATCGRLVLSGILVEQTGMIEARLNELGIGEFEVETDGEWVAIVV